MVIILPRRGQLQNCLERVLAELDNNLWAQVESQRTCTDGKPRNWTVLSIGRVGNVFIHYFISSYAFLLLAARTARTPRSWPEILFFDTVGFVTRCIQKNLWSCFWCNEFEEEGHACVHLKTSARHLQCLLSLSALLVGLRLLNVLVSLSQGILKEDHTRSVGPSLIKYQINDNSNTTKKYLLARNTFHNKSHSNASALASSPSTEHVVFESTGAPNTVQKVRKLALVGIVPNHVFFFVQSSSQFSQLCR